jgi:hypothetical protein
MQEELLSDSSGSPPMRRQLTHVGFRGQVAVAIGRTDGYTDAQVIGHNTWTSQSASEKSRCRPPSEAATRRQAGDYFGVWLVTEPCWEGRRGRRNGPRDGRTAARPSPRKHTARGEAIPSQALSVARASNLSEIWGG